jgi:hypothetical protein
MSVAGWGGECELSGLLVKEPAERPSHDAIHALLTDACPAPPTSVLAPPGAAAADLRAAQPAATSAVPGPADRSVDTLPYGAVPTPAQPTP